VHNVISVSHSGHGGERQADVRCDPADQELLPPDPLDGIADSRLIPCVDNASLDVVHPRQCLRELRQSRAPHHWRSRGEHDRDAEDARGAGERDCIVAHLVRREISNARDEPGLMVDKQEYGRLRREALIARLRPLWDWSIVLVSLIQRALLQNRITASSTSAFS